MWPALLVWRKVMLYLPLSKYATLVWRRAGSRFAPSQWGTSFFCNDVSHWLGANLESALQCIFHRLASYLQMSRSDSKGWTGASLLVPAMAARFTSPVHLPLLSQWVGMTWQDCRYFVKCHKVPELGRNRPNPLPASFSFRTISPMKYWAIHGNRLIWTRWIAEKYIIRPIKIFRF